MALQRLDKQPTPLTRLPSLLLPCGLRLVPVTALDSSQLSAVPALLSLRQSSCGVWFLW